MSNFSYKDVYVEDGKRVLEINILPEKHCNFDCIFCTLGRTKNKMDIQKSFDEIDKSLLELEKKIEDTRADLIFINSKGEAFINDKVEDIIDFVKSKGLVVRLFSNGYLLGNDKYKKIADKCEEVVGEIKIVNEEKFQKAQRPVEGYSINEYVSNMVSFNKQYKGKFIFEVTIIKGYSDDEESVEKIRNIIREIKPDKVTISTMEDEIFKKKLAISDKELKEISSELLNI